MGQHRFYLAPEAWTSKTLTLEGQEARHVHVLRLSAGDPVLLMDGQGRIGHCVIQAMSKKNVTLQCHQEEHFPQPEARAVMALAQSKAVRRGFFAEKAAELGAAAIWLWHGDCSQGKLPKDADVAWTAQMIAGIKQCGNPWLPVVRVLDGGLEGLLRACLPEDRKILPWELEDPEALIPPTLLGRPGRTIYTIGPEGGFSARELALLEAAAFQRISLGARVLRCETAATLCLGLHWWASHLPVSSTPSLHEQQ